ncbi:MAG: hypothetical protein ABF325_10835 [Lentimonas sp.]
MLADDGLGVAGLEGGIADGPEGTDGHGNVGVAKDVVTEGEFLPNFSQDTVDVEGKMGSDAKYKDLTKQ